MIKINKFNNVYEIKELKNTDLINGNTLIYAPNGGYENFIFWWA